MGVSSNGGFSANSGNSSIGAEAVGRYERRVAGMLAALGAGDATVIRPSAANGTGGIVAAVIAKLGPPLPPQLPPLANTTDAVVDKHPAAAAADSERTAVADSERAAAVDSERTAPAVFERRGSGVLPATPLLPAAPPSQLVTKPVAASELPIVEEPEPAFSRSRVAAPENSPIAQPSATPVSAYFPFLFYLDGPQDL
ncbi:hypothetical protein T492DRAFT_24717 [Pavlovales sp. CCMP2436]|nr:hypothetical protein T492DRAFT_24717 [Pavlovales sp. CCMP2436]